MRSLNIFYENNLVGTFTPDTLLHLDFVYDKKWLKWQEAFPISLMLPLQEEAHNYPKPEIFLENLLPELKIRHAIEQANHLPKDNPYQFLKQFGSDLAGAFTISDAQSVGSTPGRTTPLSLNDIDKAIKDGRSLYQTMTHDFGAKFSLAGAQDKFCVIYKEGQLSVSNGVEPSTHVAKVNLDFKNSQTVFNEYFCMRLASVIGLNIPEVMLIIEPQPILLVKRYDRIECQGKIRRLHQEDFCQAQSFASKFKYEENGGPSIVQNYMLIKNHSSNKVHDLEAYLDWISFNLIIGNNDSHSKNLAFIYHGKKVVLAPFYDLLSTHVYGRRFSQAFAYSIGATTNYLSIRKSDIEYLDRSLGIRSGKFLKNFTKISQKIEDSIESVSDDVKYLAPKATIIPRICETIKQRQFHLRNFGGLL